jgi:glycine hydroxymethyltransferase
VTSGIRLGTPAITTRGFKEKETQIMAELIIKALRNHTNQEALQEIKLAVHKLCNQFPVYS